MVQRRGSAAGSPHRPGRSQTERGASARDASSATPRAGRPRSERGAGKGGGASGRPSRTVHTRPGRKAEDGSRPRSHTTSSESRGGRAAGTTGAQRAARTRIDAPSPRATAPRDRVREGSASRTAPRTRPAEAPATRPGARRERGTEPAGRATARRGSAREASARDRIQRRDTEHPHARTARPAKKAPTSNGGPRAMIPATQLRRRKSKLPLIAAAFLLAGLLVGGAFGIDHLLNGERIYRGVSVGTVDLSGMTRQEAAVALDEAYGDHVSSGAGIIFASDEAAQTVDVNTALTEEAAQAEQLSVEEARADKKLWVAEAGTLGARIPVTDLVEEAFAIGRDGGLSQRIEAATQSVTLPVRLVFDEEALEALATEIDETIGEPRVDYNVAIEEGVTSLVEGHDGTIVDRDELRGKLAEGFLGATPDNFSFVAHASWAPSRIDAEAAEACRAFIQSVLDRGITFTFEGNQWDLGAAEMGRWITTDVIERDGVARLAPTFDEKTACADLLALIRDAGFVSAVTVSFANEGGELWVYAQDGSRYPLTADAVSAADTGIFAAFRDSGAAEVAQERPSIAIGWGAAPAKTTFDEALEKGLISKISSYTTEYNDGAGTANRRHNIHLAADLLTDSIARANGGIWSFSEVLGGEANEAMGFKGAGVISGGEYTDAIGGGICQVATTVFNAVYEGGYPVTERRNHSLYISSYPTGRDAAIAYPYLDLKWQNDTTSDVLLRTRYTDGSLTVTLYGIDPGYVVTTETGDWRPGEAYQTKTKVDENEAPGTRYVKTKGADGRSVTVHRIVRDRAGTILHEEDFESNYNPVNEVIVEGPNAPAPDEGDTDKDTDKDKEGDGKEDARVSTGD